MSEHRHLQVDESGLVTGLADDHEIDVYMQIDTNLHGLRVELAKAMLAWPSMNSAHEGYAVILEELDELWSHVKTKQKNRDLDAMRTEAIQVAAMALRFAIDVCNEKRGRK